MHWGGAHGQERHTNDAFEQCGEECCHRPPCQFGEDNGLCKSTCPTLLAQIAPTTLKGPIRGDLRCRPFLEIHICWTPWGRTSLDKLWVSGLWCSLLSVCLSMFRVCASSVSFFLIPFSLIPFSSPLLVYYSVPFCYYFFLSPLFFPTSLLPLILPSFLLSPPTFH